MKPIKEKSNITADTDMPRNSSKLPRNAKNTERKSIARKPKSS